MPIPVDTLIIGAGPCGLSCAWHLERAGKKYLIAEKNSYTGGLCASFKRDGFTYDCSGHLLHLHSDYGKKLVFDLLGQNIATLRRKAWIYSHGVYTNYPFQAALYGLPFAVVSECVNGYLEAWKQKKTQPFDAPFGEWALSVFGKGICKHFMFPYNLKLWQTPLDELRADWCAPFVPRPKPEDVIRGAYAPQPATFGYNAVFYYPKTGGIQALCDALAKKLTGPVHKKSEVMKINLHNQTAMIRGLGEVKFKHLVNTMPLKDFCAIIEDAPVTLRAAAKKLRCTHVDVLNLGFEKSSRKDLHWAYFPEKKFKFYRAGIASNFSAAVAPRGTTSFYVETATQGGGIKNISVHQRSVVAALRRCGLVKGELVSKQHIPMPCAYVIYDGERKRALETIMRTLAARNITSTGRYGGWKYSFIEEAILDGKSAAEKISR